jgi:hypothetical protein
MLDDGVRWKRSEGEALSAGGRRGLVAARAVAKGDYVVTERPSVVIQTDGNKARCLACAHCNGFAGTLLAQIKLGARGGGGGGARAGGAARFRELARLLSDLRDSDTEESAGAPAAASAKQASDDHPAASASFARLRDVLPRTGAVQAAAAAAVAAAWAAAAAMVRMAAAARVET